MSKTTIQVDTAVRGELAKIAADLDATLGETVARLITEYKIQLVMRQYEALRADPEAWASYQDESGLIDRSAGDDLSSARDEYPEYQP